jgi:acetoin utilization deacetylase AcuC-like enzyme
MVEAKSGYIFDERMVLHKEDQDYGQVEDLGECHPETPDRILAIYFHLKMRGLLEKMVNLSRSYKSASDTDLLTVHTQEQLDRLAQLTKDCEEDQDFKYPHEDNYGNKWTDMVSRLCAGAAVHLMEQILDAQIQNGFAITRPPGHHAYRDKIGGFCFYNNVSICA